MKKVLVTGGLGYVGSVLLKDLGSIDYSALVVDLSLFHEHEIIDNIIIGGFGDIDGKVLSEVDSIVHLGGISNDPIGNKFEEITNRINFLESCKLFERAKEYSNIKKFVFASSCSNYGMVSNGRLVDEDSFLNPQTAYAKSKVDFEVYLKKESVNTDINITCLRFATACGVSNSMRLDLVLNNFVDSAIRFNEIRLNSDGSAERPLINVKDMSRFICWCLSRSDSERFEVYNAGFSQNNTKIIDLAKLVSKKFDNVNLIMPENPIQDNRSYAVNFEKIKNASGYDCPLVDLEKTIDQLKEFHKKNNGWIAPAKPKMHVASLIRLEAVLENLEKINEK